MTPEQSQNLAKVKLERMCKKIAQLDVNCPLLEKERGLEVSDTFDYCGQRYLFTIYLAKYAYTKVVEE